MFGERTRLTIGRKMQLIRLAHEKSTENNATFEAEYRLGKLIERMASVGVSEETIKRQIDKYYATE